MKRMFIGLFALGLVSSVTHAATTSYIDLGPDAGVANGFWDTTAHAPVAVDVDWAAVPSGVDPRLGSSEAALSGSAFDVRGKVAEESRVMAFVSKALKALFMVFR